MAIAQGVSLLLGLAGKAIAEGDYEKAQKLKEQAVAEYGPEVLPKFEAQEAQQVGATEFSKIKEDPALREKQLEAMRKMAEMGEFGAGDEAALQLANEGVSQRAASNAASNLDALASRGVQQGGGLAAALAAQSGQDVTNATARNRQQVMADMRERALRAIQASGQMAGGIREADYARQSNIAGSQDAINRFNANQRDQALKANNAMKQAQFDAQMRLLDSRNTARQGVAAGYTNRAGRTEAMFSGLGQAAGAAGNAAAGYEQGGIDFERAKELEKLRGKK
jgi:hypothetical protein